MTLLKSGHCSSLAGILNVDAVVQSECLNVSVPFMRLQCVFAAAVSVCVLLSTVLRKYDKASNSFRVTHHLIKTEGNDYRIDGITVSAVW